MQYTVVSSIGSLKTTSQGGFMVLNCSFLKSHSSWEETIYNVPFQFTCSAVMCHGKMYKYKHVSIAAKNISCHQSPATVPPFQN